jgi:hypothetical protein
MFSFKLSRTSARSPTASRPTSSACTTPTSRQARPPVRHVDHEHLGMFARCLGTHTPFTLQGLLANRLDNWLLPCNRPDEEGDTDQSP